MLDKEEILRSYLALNDAIGLADKLKQLENKKAVDWNIKPINRYLGELLNKFF
jgi:hypothetical protein